MVFYGNVRDKNGLPLYVKSVYTADFSGRIAKFIL